MRKLSILYICLVAIKLFILSYDRSISFINHDFIDVLFLFCILSDIVLSVILLFKQKSTTRKLLFGLILIINWVLTIVLFVGHMLPPKNPYLHTNGQTVSVFDKPND